MTASTSTRPSQLPPTIRAFLAARAERAVDDALRAFGDDPVVVDDGRTFRGADEVRGFLRDAGTEFTYTTELLGAWRLGDDRWVVRHHLVGDFPGGIADLDHRFTLGGGLVAELVIAPGTDDLPPELVVVF